MNHVNPVTVEKDKKSGIQFEHALNSFQMKVNLVGGTEMAADRPLRTVLRHRSGPSQSEFRKEERRRT
jgi:hypothetical protein